MKEKSEEQSPNGLDQTPSLFAAKSAAREAGKRLAISQWPVILASGLVFSLLFVPLHYWRLGDNLTHMLVGICLIIASISVILWLALRRRMGIRVGVVAVPMQGAGSPLIKSVVVGMVVGFAAGGGLFLFLLFHPQPLSSWSKLTGLTIIMAAIILLLLRQVARTGLWEQMLFLAPISAWPAYDTKDWFWLLFGTTQIFIGTVFFIRWRRWVRSIPREKSETPESAQ